MSQCNSLALRFRQVLRWIRTLAWLWVMLGLWDRCGVGQDRGRRAGLGSARVPCTAALAPCLLAAVPLARSPRRGWDFGGSRRSVPRRLGPLQRGPRLRAGVVRCATFT